MEGDGPIDLVFVPGFVYHLEVAREYPANRSFIEKCTRFGRLITYDKREQGLSDRLGRPPTLEESMDDLRTVMDAAGSERAVLLGISEGGPMSMLSAATHPARVQALILYGTFASIESEGMIGSQGVDGLLKLLERNWGGPAAAEVWAPTMAGDQEFLDWWAKLLRQGTSLSGAKNLLAMYKEIDVRPILDTIDVPTLVLRRRDDIVTPAGLADELAAKIPNAKLVELPGADHVWSLGDQDAIIGEIEEFLTGHRSAREPERVLSTVLFTDIVGSTERAAALGDADWRDLLGRHDALVRRQVERHAAARSSPPVTATSRRSTALPAACGARRTSRPRSSASGSRYAPACTRASAS